MARKLVVVTGATGAQGGSIARILLKTGEYDVRAITRNPSSDKGKELEKLGATVVSADYDDVASLQKAFEGAYAVFAVTNFWEHMFRGKSPKESGAAEGQQAWNLALAASKTSTLEHYVWSTLPGASDMSNGKFPVPHLDFKAAVDKRIKAELPELAKKTTFYWFAFYTSNWGTFIKFVEVPMTGKHLYLCAQDPESKIGVTGDMEINPGVIFRQILANPDKTRGRYVYCKVGEPMTWTQQIAEINAVTGKQIEIIRITDEEHNRIYGHFGQEILDQFHFGEQVPNWEATLEGFVTLEEIGVKPDELVSNRATLEKHKATLV